MADGGLAILSVACLAAAVAAVVAGLVVWRRVRRPGDPGPVDHFRSVDEDALRGDPRSLKPGDIAEVRGRTYAVRGSVVYAEGSWTWAEHLLDTAEGDKVWLSVEEDPDLEIALWTAVPTATVTPGAKTIDFDGRRYVSDESGRATYTAAGSTGLVPSGTVRFHDYCAPDGALLSFERYGDSQRWEVGRGERLHRAELRIYPHKG
jgi:hypothetical protein